ncbi:hypothetical protein [Brucella anthropi]|uniref:hypothetical protein n=1 Tax=Brucella anthropi TaxID=529 RepID=UPI000CFC1DE3|nr:hypothetical protein [Ochrobactrum sp. MYb49]PQZ62730.1 hypothetical protein CQ057_14890 [Ochrobactrum sp. MYb49]
MDDPNKSIWIHDWTDEKTKDRYLFHVREQYEKYKSFREMSFQNHVGYAKWLLASLLAVHGGAIYGISGLRDSVSAHQIDGLITGAGWNLIGIGFTLLTGFCSWVNFQSAWSTYEEWADPAMLYRTDQHPATQRTGSKFDLSAATLYAGAGFGLASAFCFAASAAAIISTLRTVSAGA